MNYTATLALLLSAFRFRLADEARPGRAPQQAPPCRAAQGRPVVLAGVALLEHTGQKACVELSACLSQSSRAGLPARCMQGLCCRHARSAWRKAAGRQRRSRRAAEVVSSLGRAHGRAHEHHAADGRRHEDALPPAAVLG